MRLKSSGGLSRPGGSVKVSESVWQLELAVGWGSVDLL